jgi:addiction module HigA family antidote
MLAQRGEPPIANRDEMETGLMAKKLAPRAPGDILRTSFLVRSASLLVRSPKRGACRAPAIDRLASEETSVTADTALRLGTLGTSAQLWLNRQNEYDVRAAEIGSARNWRKSVGESGLSSQLIRAISEVDVFRL